jgi:N-acetylglucosamine kinase-like BadF-type ATPase
VVVSDESPAVRILGIDVGGTKTHLAGVDAEGGVVDRVFSSSEWRSGSLFSDPDNFDRLGTAVESLGSLAPDAVVVAGVHGCDTPEQMAETADRLGARLGVQVAVVNDAQLLEYAARISPCIQMIVGTGAVISGTTDAGTRVTVDGHGWPLGDRGSSHAIVSAALAETLRASDRGEGGSDRLFGAMFDAFGVDDAAALAVVSSSIAGGESWGRHASVVFEEAAAGSAAAMAIIDESSRILARGVADLIRRGAVGATVVAGGGVIVNQPGYEARIRQHLATEAPGVELLVIRIPPVEGAVNLARMIHEGDRPSFALGQS